MDGCSSSAAWSTSQRRHQRKLNPPFLATDSYQLFHNCGWDWVLNPPFCVGILSGLGFAQVLRMLSQCSQFICGIVLLCPPDGSLQSSQPLFPYTHSTPSPVVIFEPWVWMCSTYIPLGLITMQSLILCILSIYSKQKLLC